ncbi:hypothetical protein DFH27DRAFT_572707 [Peziza echinospora]|nr:hypothetical protein DFH27DRAFT_572707 [Peziza echinospora]
MLACPPGTSSYWRYWLYWARFAVHWRGQNDGQRKNSSRSAEEKRGHRCVSIFLEHHRCAVAGVRVGPFCGEDQISPDCGRRSARAERVGERGAKVKVGYLYWSGDGLGGQVDRQAVAAVAADGGAGRGPLELGWAGLGRMDGAVARTGSGEVSSLFRLVVSGVASKSYGDACLLACERTCVRPWIGARGRGGDTGRIGRKWASGIYSHSRLPR